MNRAKCGTNSGYQSHTYYKTTPCEACRIARREHQRNYRNPKVKAGSRWKPHSDVTPVRIWCQTGKHWGTGNPKLKIRSVEACHECRDAA